MPNGNVSGESNLPQDENIIEEDDVFVEVK
jgi:hypothetical protein